MNTINSKKVWDNNNIQYPRLLSEIFAVADLTDAQMSDVAESMGLCVSEVQFLFTRAESDFESVKEALKSKSQNRAGKKVVCFTVKVEVEADDETPICEDSLRDNLFVAIERERCEGALSTPDISVNWVEVDQV